LDYSFLYGFGLFETMRAYEGRVFRLENHLNRLVHSAEILGLPIRVTDLKYAVMATIEANQLTDARIRITVSIGEGSMIPDPGTCKQPTVLIMAGDYRPYPERVYKKGFRVVVSSIRRYSKSPLARIKSANYLENILAKQEAIVAGVDETLCLNEKGFLTEASMSNIFLVNDGVLQTPRLENGILPGITRDVVLEIATQLGIVTTEKDINLEEVFQSRESFLTNSLIEIMPLTEVDGKPLGSGRLGPVTQRLMANYKKLVLSSRNSE